MPKQSAREQVSESCFCTEAGRRKEDGRKRPLVDMIQGHGSSKLSNLIPFIYIIHFTHNDTFRHMNSLATKTARHKYFDTAFSSHTTWSRIDT